MAHATRYWFNHFLEHGNVDDVMPKHPVNHKIPEAELRRAANEIANNHYTSLQCAAEENKYIQSLLAKYKCST